MREPGHLDLRGPRPGEHYDVYVTWNPQSGASQTPSMRSTRHTAIPGAGPAIDQTQAPVDDEGDGNYWHSLGVYNATSGTLVVTLTAGDSGNMLADAVTIVRYEAAPTMGLAINSFTFVNSGEINVSYTVTDAAAPPFSIGIYGSPDGVRQGDLFQTYDVSDPTPHGQPVHRKVRSCRLQRPGAPTHTCLPY